MFSRETYIQRRAALRQAIASGSPEPAGLLLFLGNEESPMNYGANCYTFRQDSSFLYYWGVDHPGLAAVLDVDSGAETLFGDDPTVADIVWTGPQPLLCTKAERVGVANALPRATLGEAVTGALKQGRRVHYLPPYRAINVLKIAGLLGIRPTFSKDYASLEFTKAVIAQRSFKTAEELAEIEKAIDVTGEMQTYAMRTTRPGMVEREVVAGMQAIAVASGGNLAFPIIFTIHGETLHNLKPDHTMKDGNIAVCDIGAETAMHYAADLTRTIPVSGKFDARQREVYQIVLEAQLAAIAATKPGVPHIDVHKTACRTLFSGLAALGLAKGDPAEAVEAGASAMFFQCGYGHMMGFDVHDMEDLGEKWVGYDGAERTTQFGLCYLRLGKPLKPGFVVTAEPGVYIIPELIDQWKSEHKFEQYINYAELDKWRDFGGIRIEDDLIVTETGNRILGKPVPKTISEVEAACAR